MDYSNYDDKSTTTFNLVIQHSGLERSTILNGKTHVISMAIEVNLQEGNLVMTLLFLYSHSIPIDYKLNHPRVGEILGFLVAQFLQQLSCVHIPGHLYMVYCHFCSFKTVYDVDMDLLL